MPQLTIQQALNLAMQHHRSGQLAQAEQMYRQVLTHQPNHPDALQWLGMLAAQVGRNDAAVDLISRAVALRPNDAQVRSNLGNALLGAGRREEAIAAYRQAIVLKDDFAAGHYNLAIALLDKGDLGEAVAACQRSVALDPNVVQARVILGNAWRDLGQLDQAIDCYREAMAVQPRYAMAHSNLCLAMHYHPGYDAAAIAEEHRRWNQVQAQPLAGQIRPHPNDRAPERRLRIGYVSPDFREHAVAHFFMPLLTTHDRGQFEIFCYANVSRPDPVTRFIQEHCDAWRGISALSDEQAVALVRQDQIDILVDLAGHTGENRLLVFAPKPAPVQISYLGYPATTGMAAIDYRFSDSCADPPGLTDAHCTEKLIRLPGCFLCYSGAAEALSVAELPALGTGQITFASFNNFTKISPPALDAWAKILHAVPASRLILKARSLADAGVRQHARQLFQQRGVEEHRLELLGTQISFRQHMEWYGRVDIALDSFPYNGTTTTCEALWMGVPVIGLAGNTHVSRVGVSLLSNIGLAELVADTPESYVEIAVNLAKDLPRLGALRKGMRERMQRSPLMDAKGYTTAVEAAYRQMWRKWCQENPVAS